MTVHRKHDRELDVVVFGATGFVGRLVAEYLAEHAPESVRIGLAGRSLDRLTQVRAGLGGTAREWPLLVADTSDPSSLAALAESTRVVATTVGPYARYGMPLVEACARAGTDYADLTGEVLFVRETLDRWNELAASTGARIVHSCGFDSIPSDLGVHLLAERAR
ncbi:MAG TPA: saccharopine dehydrogenase NADP-binding domain-containing protein, partial [Dermatophilaceae bacterium]|nr:saccharopine dehydrogenase NADP-binding domain-containing protein [Dermatophilaceae bacterium]